MGLGLRQYFQDELTALRQSAKRFSDDHPEIARELRLAKGYSRDPQVELLMQSFAFLTGRLNFRLDEERGLIPNLLLGLIYPHLQAPIPSMAVAQIKVKPDGANFADGWTLKRGRQMLAQSKTTGGGDIQCRMSACYDTPLLPLDVSDVALVSANEFSNLPTKAASVLRVNLKREGDEAIANIALDRLRFHLHSDQEEQSFELYHLLQQHCSGVLVRSGQGAEAQQLKPDAIRWMGFSPEEAALPDDGRDHPGFRLLQEYFAFREKFLFFELKGVDASQAEGELQILFLLKEASNQRFPRDILRLNCVPLVNLYPQRLEPLRLDQRHYEYRVVGDAARHRYCEIHSLLELSALQADGSERELAPYFSATRYDQLVDHDYFYLGRRTISQFPSVPGTELYASFLDLNLSPQTPPGDAIVGRALCTNRRLAEHLSPADRLELEGAGPVENIRLLGKPSPHHSPGVLGKEPWSLMAQLTPNFLSLSDHVNSLGVLKRMLSLHSDPEDSVNRAEIRGLTRFQCRQSVQQIPMRADGMWRGLARGIECVLEVNEDAFKRGSTLMFAEVLQHFLSQYAAANSFTALTLKGGKNNGEIKQWPPMIGGRLVL